MNNSYYELFCQKYQPKILSTKSIYNIYYVNNILAQIEQNFSTNFYKGALLIKTVLFSEIEYSSFKSNVTFNEIITWLKIQKFNKDKLDGCIYIISKLYNVSLIQINKILNDNKYWL